MAVWKRSLWISCWTTTVKHPLATQRISKWLEGDSLLCQTFDSSRLERRYVGSYKDKKESRWIGQIRSAHMSQIWCRTQYVAQRGNEVRRMWHMHASTFKLPRVRISNMELTLPPIKIKDYETCLVTSPNELDIHSSFSQSCCQAYNFYEAYLNWISLS